MKKFLKSFLVLILVAGIATNLCASDQQEKPELKRELVKLKYVRAEDVTSILRGYSSQYGYVNANARLNVVSIRDIPEIVDKMLSLIKKIDVKPIDLILTVDLILGSNVLMEANIYAGSDKEKPYTKELESDPLIRELKNLLGYKYYSKVDSTFIRVQDRGRSRQKIGGPGLDLVFELQPQYVKGEKKDTIHLERLELGQYKYNREKKRYYSPLIETPITLKVGERTVVGVSKLDGGKTALILIISGKIVK